MSKYRIIAVIAAIFAYTSTLATDVLKDGLLYHEHDANRKIAAIVWADPNYIFPDTLVIPDYVEMNDATYKVGYIWPKVFLDNKNLKHVTFGDVFDAIMDEAFKMSSVTGVDFPVGIKIGTNAFELTDNLSELYLPENTGIAPCAFLASGFRNVYISKGVEWGLGSLMGNNVENITFAPYFEGYIPARSLGGGNVKELVIPGGARIENFTFERWSALEKLTFKAGDNDAERFKYTLEIFWECPNLSEIVCENPTPPRITDNLFEPALCQRAVLKVPGGSADAYRNAEGWQLFTQIEEMAGIVNVESDNATLLYTEYYNTMGQRIYSMPKGCITIIKEYYSDGMVKTTKTISTEQQ